MAPSTLKPISAPMDVWRLILQRKVVLFAGF